MKITLNNLGPIKKASFELADLTVICGKNNTGKTYATYALFGFLETWQRYVMVDISRQQIDEIVNNGVTNINLSNYANKSKDILSRGARGILSSYQKSWHLTQNTSQIQNSILTWNRIQSQLPRRSLKENCAQKEANYCFQ